MAMKGCWSIQVDAIHVYSFIPAQYAKTPEILAVPLGFGIFSDEEFDSLRQSISEVVPVAIEGVIHLPEKMQVAKCRIPEAVSRQFAGLSGRAMGRWFVISYEQYFMEVPTDFEQIKCDVVFHDSLILQGIIRFVPL
jgi:hypothetical protein